MPAHNFSRAKGAKFFSSSSIQVDSLSHASFLFKNSGYKRDALNISCKQNNSLFIL